MLVKHLRDVGIPYATIVALYPDQIGLSICCTKDHFSKKRGVEIAKGRAIYNCKPEVPNRLVYHYDEGNYVIKHMSEVVYQELVNMEKRAQK